MLIEKEMLSVSETKEEDAAIVVVVNKVATKKVGVNICTGPLPHKTLSQNQPGTT